jgi:hypothetical protein
MTVEMIIDFPGGVRVGAHFGPFTVQLDIELPTDFPEQYRAAVIRAAEQCAVKKLLEPAGICDSYSRARSRSSIIYRPGWAASHDSRVIDLTCLWRSRVDLVYARRTVCLPAQPDQREQHQP